MDIIDSKRFYVLSDIPTLFQEKMDRTLNWQTPLWLDNIIIVTKGYKEKHRKKLITILEKLEETGYRASEKKSGFFLEETTLLGREITEHGIEPNKGKIKAI